MAGRIDRGRAPAARLAAALVLGALLVATACEPVVVADANAARSAVGVGALTTSPALTEAARAHSAEMCATGVVAPAPDPAAAYLADEGATGIDDLVGSAALDPGIADWSERNAAAADEIWSTWVGEATLVDPRWQSVGVGEVECGDGRLYSTLVLRDDPPPLSAPADTTGIALVQSVTKNGWRFDQYRNASAPCAISGFQTFVIGTEVGSSSTATRPLWVKLRGGGAGWFDTDGTPLPSAAVKSEEGLALQLSFDTPGLMAQAKAAPEGFRLLIVSLCSHDIYAGNDNFDPYNPNLLPDGSNRPTTGLTSTKAAIQFTLAAYPTDDYVLHGTSAGGFGSIHLAWALQEQGMAPAAVVADSGVLNQAWQRYVAEIGIPGTPGCEKTTEARGYGVLGRIDRTVGDPANEPHLLVSSGRLTVPILHVWSHNDTNVCGDVPIPCPLPDGSSPILGAADCAHEPFRLAIDRFGAATHSVNLPVCVEGGDASMPCDRHVVTTVAGGVNSDPASPADYQSAILDWVRQRLADD